MAVKVRIVSPKTYPLDPRNEQTRTPLVSIRPTVRVFHHQTRDASRLLQLPDEILWIITQRIAQENQGRYLSQFALANRECRQLARPYQFADVWITRSELSWNFLRYLRNERSSEMVPSIGSLIRYLTITTDKDYHHSWGFDPRGLGAEEAGRIERWEVSWSGILSDLAHVLQWSMSNLDHLYWMDTGELDRCSDQIVALLQAVLQSCSSTGGFKKLYFEDYGFVFDELEQTRPIIRHFPAEPSLNIQDLAFGYNRFQPKYSDPDGGTSFFVETLLRRCASTLESYAWSSDFEGVYDGTGTAKIEFRDGPIAFPRLRKFWSYTDDFTKIATEVIESFLSGPLESFAPSLHICSVILENGLVGKYPLPHLRTFVVTGQPCDIDLSNRQRYVDGVLDLGRYYGPQLEELFIYLDRDYDSGFGQLISHYASGRFSNLRALCFVWADDFSLEVLQTIGSNLVALEELSFGFPPDAEQTGAVSPASVEFDRLKPFLVDPDSIVRAISPLQKLERLAIFGDEYVADWAGQTWAWHRFFKDHVWYHQGRSHIHRKTGPAPGEGQDWSDATRGHKRPGNLVEDGLTLWATETSSLEEAGIAVHDMAARFAKVLPELRELMIGRHLAEITGR